MTRARIRRTVRLPSPLRLARLERAPDVGPRLLFFSGGTALRELSRELIRYTHNSIHLITPFDSGGSSAHLRRAFDMLAVGDLRNRLMALADQSLHGNPEIFDLFDFRLPADESPSSLERWLRDMVSGDRPRVARIPTPMREIVRRHLRVFHRAKPDEFDLGRASIGNLVLTGGYLNHERTIDPVLYLFSRLVEVRGTVRPVVNVDLHLAAELESGETVVGQHRITDDGRERGGNGPESPIRRLRLVESLEEPRRAEIDLERRSRELIGQADLICYPMGSFFTSVIASLLPMGTGAAVADRDVPKVYLPNTGEDPEQRGHSLPDAVRILSEHLRRSGADDAEIEDLLHFVLVDASRSGYSENELREVEELGVEVIDTRLVTSSSAPYLDGERLARVLASMA